MTIIATIYVSEGIVMAADSSRITTKPSKDNLGNTIHEIFVSSYNSQKIFLFDGFNIGISSFGIALPNGKLLPFTLEQFKNEYLHKGDDINIIAQKLYDFINKEVSKYSLAFHLAGYSNNEPFVYIIDPSRKKLDIVNHNDNSVIYGMAWGGQPDTMSRLISNRNDIQYDIMSIVDAIEFVKFCLETTIKLDKFLYKPVSCGGPIDILLITPKEIKWVQHKLYCPAHYMI